MDDIAGLLCEQRVWDKDFSTPITFEFRIKNGTVEPLQLLPNLEINQEQVKVPHASRFQEKADESQDIFGLRTPVIVGVHIVPPLSSMVCMKLDSHLDLYVVCWSLEKNIPHYPDKS